MELTPGPSSALGPEAAECVKRHNRFSRTVSHEGVYTALGFHTDHVVGITFDLCELKVQQNFTYQTFALLTSLADSAMKNPHHGLLFNSNVVFL